MTRFTRCAVALVTALAAAACGSGDDTAVTPSADAGSFAPPPVGVQLATTPVALAAGQEQYLCWSFRVPGPTPLALVAVQTDVPSVGVHHYAVFTNAGAWPTNPSGYDCHVMDGSWGLVTGGGVGTAGLTFPAGTAMTLAPGTQLVLQLHLLNPTANPVQPFAAINLVGSTQPNLTPVGLLIAGTLKISIPPYQSNYVVQGGCAAPFAMNSIFALFPHMHRLGTRISVSLTPAGQNAAKMLFDGALDFGNQGV